MNRPNNILDSRGAPDKSLLVRALIFSFVINLPALYSYFLFGPFSIGSFSEWDEPYYLELSRQIGRVPLNELWHYLPGLPPEISLRNIFFPHSVVDIIAGKLAALLQLDMISIALFCDLALCALSYLAFTQLFRRLTGSAIAAECGAFGLLAFPCLASISLYAHIPFSFGRFASFELSPAEIRLPILRSFYVQWSYPLFAFSLSRIIDALRSRARREQNGAALLAGVFSGLSSYTYFYAWALTSALGAVAIVFDALVPLGKTERNERAPARLGTCFVLANLAVALPGLLILSALSARDELQMPSGTSRSLIVSAENAVFLLITLVVLRFSGPHHPARPSLWLVTATLCTGLLLPLGQFLTGVPLQLFHFPLYYLDPLLSGALIAACLSLSFSDRVRSGVAALFAAVVLFFSAGGCADVGRNSTMREFAELALFLDGSPGAASEISVIHLNDPFSPSSPANFLSRRLLPFWIQALTSTRAFLVPEKKSSDVDVISERALGFYFTGRVELVGNCPAEPIELPGDLSWGTRTEAELYRASICRRNRELASYDACSVVSDFRPRYLLWESSFSWPKPAWFDAAASSVWTSSSGSLTVYEINNKALREAVCPREGAPS